MPRTTKLENAAKPRDITAIPDIGSRWVHADCRRIARVTKVHWLGGGERGAVWAADVSFRYERGSGGTQRRWTRTPTAEQTYKIDDWIRLFSEPAPKAEG